MSRQYHLFPKSGSAGSRLIHPHSPSPRFLSGFLLCPLGRRPQAHQEQSSAPGSLVQGLKEGPWAGVVRRGPQRAPGNTGGGNTLQDTGRWVGLGPPGHQSCQVRLNREQPCPSSLAPIVSGHFHISWHHQHARWALCVEKPGQEVNRVPQTCSHSGSWDLGAQGTGGVGHTSPHDIPSLQG